MLTASTVENVFHQVSNQPFGVVPNLSLVLGSQSNVRDLTHVIATQCQHLGDLFLHCAYHVSIIRNHSTDNDTDDTSKTPQMMRIYDPPDWNSSDMKALMRTLAQKLQPTIHYHNDLSALLFHERNNNNNTTCREEWILPSLFLDDLFDFPVQELLPLLLPCRLERLFLGSMRTLASATTARRTTLLASRNSLTTISLANTVPLWEDQPMYDVEEDTHTTSIISTIDEERSTPYQISELLFNVEENGYPPHESIPSWTQVLSILLRWNKNNNNHHHKSHTMRTPPAPVVIPEVHMMLSYGIRQDPPIVMTKDHSLNNELFWQTLRQLSIHEFRPVISTTTLAEWVFQGLLSPTPFSWDIQHLTLDLSYECSLIAPLVTNFLKRIAGVTPHNPQPSSCWNIPSLELLLNQMRQQQQQHQEEATHSYSNDWFHDLFMAFQSPHLPIQTLKCVLPTKYHDKVLNVMEHEVLSSSQQATTTTTTNLVNSTLQGLHIASSSAKNKIHSSSSSGFACSFTLPSQNVLFYLALNSTGRRRIDEEDDDGTDDGTGGRVVNMSGSNKYWVNTILACQTIDPWYKSAYSEYPTAKDNPQRQELILSTIYHFVRREPTVATTLLYSWDHHF